MKRLLNLGPGFTAIAWIALVYLALFGGVDPLHLMRPASVQAQAPAAYGFITYADITGTGSNIQVDSTAGHSCRWIQLVTPSTNSTTLTRWGDTNISGTRGGLIPAGGGQTMLPLPALGGQEQRYDITKLFVNPNSGDKISVVCGQ